MSNTTGSQNSAVGREAGRYIANGSTALTIVNNSTYLGVNTKASADSVTNETVIGYNAIGSGSNTITLGSSTVTGTIIPYGNVGIGNTPSGTYKLEVTGNIYSTGATFNTNATGFVRQAATVAPTVDMLQITNAGFPIVTAGTSALQINYIGGAAAVESSASRLDLTPGTTTGGIWNGFRSVITTDATTGVTINGVKMDTIATPGAGTSNSFYVGTGWDNILNYNGTTIISGTGGGAFTTLSASSTVSGTGFSTYLASPPSIGVTTAAAGKFTDLEYTGTLTGSTGVLNIGSGQIYKDASGNVGIGVTPIANNGILQLNGHSSIKTLLEKVTITASVPAATTYFDASTQAVQYYTTTSTANFTLVVRGNSTTTLNTIMQIGQSLTIALIITNTTAYWPSTFQIDGVTTTVKWQNGSTPTGGNASALDCYTYTIIKTAASTYTVLGSQTKYA